MHQYPRAKKFHENQLNNTGFALLTLEILIYFIYSLQSKCGFENTTELTVLGHWLYVAVITRNYQKPLLGYISSYN